MQAHRSLLLCLPLQAVCLWLILGCDGPVRTPRQPVTTEYHGVKVVDDYQWLEAGSDPAVRKWSVAQNKRTRAQLDRIPERALIERRLTELNEEITPNYYALQWHGGRLFALKFRPPAQQPVLVTLDSPNETKTEKVILDLNKLSTNGTTSIDFYQASPDGKIVAVSLSAQGSEDGTLHFYEVNGEKLPDEIPGVQYPTGGGSVAWNADSSGVFYTRYPRKGERPDADLHFFQQVYFHKLGAPASEDRYEIGKEFPRIAEIDLKSSSDGRWIAATVANGDGGEFEHYLRNPDGQWRRIARYEDRVKQLEFGRDPAYIEVGKDLAVYLLSKKKAPRGKILRLPFEGKDVSAAKEIIKEGKQPIEEFKPSAGGLYVVDLHGGPVQVRYYDSFEKREYALETRRIISIEQLLVTRGDEALVRVASFTEPYAWVIYDPNKDRTKVTPSKLRGVSPVSFDDIEPVRVTVKSKDGAKVPLTVLRRRGTRLTGDHPTILTGYGGYGVSVTPRFDVSRRVWFDQGGILAIANLRGGGEFGEEWHQGGMLTNKQNVFDDFAACAQYLIESKHTSPPHLAIEGRSNGGLLMGAMLTQHPDLIKAVVSHVGIYDMLRVELDPNGEFNTTEFGTVKDPAHFKALHAYSPYHHVPDGTNHPAVLLLTGEHDGRVNPAHSRKMTARLQAASQRPVLLRTSFSSGHGLGTAFSERLASLTDVYAFLLWQLGMDYTQIERGPWSGGITSTSAVVKARLMHDDLSARLRLSETPDFARPVYVGPVTSQGPWYRIVTFEARGLKPDTQYYYALEVDRRLDRVRSGALRTFPPENQPASFTFAWASCGRTASTNSVYDVIRSNRPVMYMNVGDFHYLDLTTNSRTAFRAAYDTVLGSVQQADLYRAIPFNYIYDDHDYGGNNTDKRSNTREMVHKVYQEYVPHYPLAAGGGNVPLYHSFVIGRAKFIVTDLRSERDDVRKLDDEKKSTLGAKQKEWFKQELLSAKDKYPLICWISSFPWLGQTNTNYYPITTNMYGFIHHTNLVEEYKRRPRGPFDAEHWCAFSTERREIADFVKSNHITGLCILHGDSHMLAADDGSHGDFATGGGAPIPVMCAAPLDQNPSLKGGLYSQGVYRVKPGEGCFGLLFVEDRGEVIEVRYSGRNNQDLEKISLRFTVPVSPRLARKR